MARQGTIFSDENNVCPLDSPIPLSLYKNLKKKQIPRFRPRTMRDFLRNQLKYNTNDTLDDTAYDRTDINDKPPNGWAPRSPSSHFRTCFRLEISEPTLFIIVLTRLPLRQP